MKILIIIDDLLSAGTENVLANRIKHLSNDIDFYIITLYARGQIANIIEEMGVTVNFIDMGKVGYFNSLKNVMQIVKNETPDLTICMRDVARGFFPIFLKRFSPVVMFWDNPIIKRSFKQALAEKIQMTLFKPNIYTSSKTIAQALEKIYGPRDITVINNSYDESKFFKKNLTEKASLLAIKPTGGIKIISVGNMRDEKQHIDQIFIAKGLKEQGVDFSLKIVGDGDFCELRKLIEKYKLNSEVSLLGECNDIPELMRDSHIFLLTSQSEGFPVALLEAMGCGLTAILYKYPGLEEIDKDFSHIDAFPQKSIDDVIKQIIFYKNNQEKLIQLGEKAAIYVKDKFSAKKNSQQWKQYLTNIIN